MAAVKLFCLSDLNGVCNLAGNEVVSIHELANRIGQLIGKRPVFRSTRTEVKDMAGSTARLSGLFQPAVSLPSGLRQTINYLCPGVREEKRA